MTTLYSLSVRRIINEYKECQDFRNAIIKIHMDEENIFHWNILIVPNDGIYKNIPLHFVMIFSNTYPFNYQVPKIYMPYYIKHTNTVLINNHDVYDYEFRFCDIDIHWTNDYLHIKNYLYHLYWFFNTNYIYNETGIELTHIFYERRIQDGIINIITTNEAKIILYHMLYCMLLYNRSKKIFDISSYTRNIISNVEQFVHRSRCIRTYNEELIKQNVLHVFSSMENASDTSKVEQNRISRNAIYLFTEKYLTHYMRYKPLHVYKKKIQNISKKYVRENEINYSILRFIEIFGNVYSHSLRYHHGTFVINNNEDERHTQKTLTNEMNMILDLEYLTIDNIYKLLYYCQTSNTFSITSVNLWKVLDIVGYHADLTPKRNSRCKQFNSKRQRHNFQNSNEIIQNNIQNNNNTHNNGDNIVLSVNNDSHKNMEKKGSCLEHMPCEIVEHIISYLNESDIRSLLFTCKQLYIKLKNPYHWEKRTLKCRFTKEIINKNILCIELYPRDGCHDFSEHFIFEGYNEFSYIKYYIPYIINNNISINVFYQHLQKNPFNKHNIILPFIANIRYHSEDSIRHMLEKMTSKMFHHCKWHKDEEQDFHYTLVNNVFSELLTNTILKIGFSYKNMQLLSQYIELLSQFHYMYLYLVKQYPSIETDNNQVVDNLLYHTDYSLKSKNMFVAIIQCGLSTKHNWLYIKKRLKKEIYKRLLCVDKVSNVSNYVRQNNFQKSTCEYIIKLMNCMYVAEILLKTENSSKMYQMYERNYGFMPRKKSNQLLNKLNLFNTFNKQGVNDMSKINHIFLYNELTETLPTKSHICNKYKYSMLSKIYKEIQKCYYCARKCRYIST